MEGMIFHGALLPVHGKLWPDLSRPGLGLELRVVQTGTKFFH
jgi:hypothetical protein